MKQMEKFLGGGKTCADLGDWEMVIAITQALPVKAGSFHYW